MNGKLFVTSLMAALMIVFSTSLIYAGGGGSTTYLAHYDSIGNQWGRGTYTGMFVTKGMNSTTDSAATIAVDSGASAGDSSSHIMTIYSDYKFNGSLDTIGVIFPKGFKVYGADTLRILGGNGIDSVRADSNFARKITSITSTSGTGGRGDTLKIALDSTMGGAATAAVARQTGKFVARLKLRGVYNDTSLFPVDSSKAATRVGRFLGYKDTIIVYGINSTVTRVIQENVVLDTLFTVVSAGNKYRVQFIQGTGLTGATATDTAGLQLWTGANTVTQWSTSAPSSNRGIFWAGIVDKYGNVLESDSSTTVKLEIYNKALTVKNPPAGRNLRVWSAFTAPPNLIADYTVIHKGVSFAQFQFIGFTGAGTTSGLDSIIVKVSAANQNLTIDSALSAVRKILPTQPKTVTITGFTDSHTSPDTIATATAKVLKVVVTDTFENYCYKDTLSIGSSYGGTMTAANPHYFQGVFRTYDQTTASSNPDSALVDSVGQFKFTYTTTTILGVDTLFVTPHYFYTLKTTSPIGQITSLKQKYVIRVTAGPVAQVLLTPVTDNLNIHSSHTKSASRYISRQKVHPDSSFFYGGVTAGDTLTLQVLFKDQVGNYKHVSTADLSTIAFNDTGRKGTKLTASPYAAALDSVMISGTQYYVGKYYYASKTTLDRDSIRVTYGSYSSPYLIFQTVGGAPAKAILMAPDSMTQDSGAGASYSSVDTVQVADSTLIQGLVYDKYGNNADSNYTIYWSILNRPTGGRDGYNNKFSTYYTTLADTSTVKGKTTGADSIRLFKQRAAFSGWSWTQAFPDTVGKGRYLSEVSMLQTWFFPDSAAGLVKLTTSYGSVALDTLVLYKQPKEIKYINLSTSQNATFTTTKVDTSIISGQTINVFARFYDVYNNIVKPDILYGKGPRLQKVIYSTAYKYHPRDSIFAVSTGFKGRADSLRFFQASDTLGTWIDSTNAPVEESSGYSYLRFSFRTTGTKSGRDTMFIWYDPNTKYATSPTDASIAKDSIRIKTTIPTSIASFRISLSSVWTTIDSATTGSMDTSGTKAGTVGRPMRVRLYPIATNGYSIYSYSYRYLKLQVISASSANDTLTLPLRKVNNNRKGIYWAKAYSTNEDSLTDGTQGSAVSIGSGGTKTFTDNSEDFLFTSSYADTNVVVKVWTLPADTAVTDTVLRVSDGSAAKTGAVTYATGAMFSLKPVSPDTILLTKDSSVIGYKKDVPFSLNIAVSDSFGNAINDTAVIVTVTASENDLNGIDNRIAVKTNKTIKITPTRELSSIEFYASASENVFGGTISPTIYGKLAGSSSVTVSTASINAPLGLRGRDYPNDRGGWIVLSWPPSLNHPNNPNTTIDDALPIDYYMIYRSVTNSIATAMQWEIVPAVPLPTGLDSVRVAVSVHGDTSQAAYYWIAAVKGVLPPGIATSGSVDRPVAKPAIELPEGVVLGIPVTDDMKLSLSKASETVAVASVEGSIISPVTNNVKVRSIDNTLGRGIFVARPNKTTIELEDVLVVATVFGDATNFDPVFDLVADGVIDIRDLYFQISRLGSRAKVGKEGKLIDDGKNLGAALSVASAAANSGAQFSVQVSIDKSSEVAGFKFTVTYDPKNYEFVEATEGAFLASNKAQTLFITNDETKGQVTVVGLITGKDMKTFATGNGILSDLKFNWISEEMSEITVDGIQLVDPTSLMNELKPVKLESPIALPTEYSLNQNYPNPFNPETTIKFALKETGHVTLTIYNILGQRVKTLVSENMKAGFKTMIWNGTNDMGAKVASGVYIYQIKSGKFVAQKKMVFMK